MTSCLFTLCFAATTAAQNGTVTGVVTNSGTSAAVVDSFVTLCSNTGCSSASTASGSYSLSLPPDTYFAYTSTPGRINLVDEIYNDIPCVGSCGDVVRTTGTPIVVTSGATVTRDFALSPGGSIAGTVRSTAGAAAPGVFVNVYVVGRTQFVKQTSTDSAGNYSIGGLPSGTYFVATQSGYVNEVFDDVLCPGACSVALATGSGRGISVVSGQTSSGVNFALALSGRISGQVRRVGPLSGIAGVTVRAYVRAGAGAVQARSATTDGSGNFTISGLPSGDYYLATDGPAIDEIYGNIACAALCDPIETVNSGQTVTVSGNATTSGVVFDLESGGSVAGTVTDRVSHLPVSGVTVTALRDLGNATVTVASAQTDANGAYTVTGLPGGDYRLTAGNVALLTHVTHVYGGADCAYSCTSTFALTSGTVLTVANGAALTGRDMELLPAGVIKGTLTNGVSGAPIAGAKVLLPFAPDQEPQSFITNAAGGFTIPKLPAGPYRLGTAAASLANEAYDDVVCPSGVCSSAFLLASGTPVTVTAGGTTSGLTLALGALSAAPGPPIALNAVPTPSGITVTWQAPSTGGVATSYSFEGGLAPGTTAATFPTGTPSIVLPPLPAGTYYLRARAVNAFGTGPASEEFQLIVSGGGVVVPGVPTNVVALISGQRLTLTWNAPASGPVPDGYLVEAGTAAGQSNIAVLPVSTRSFTFEPVPPGFYFLRVRSVVGAAQSAPSPDEMIVVGGAPAPPSAPRAFGATVTGSTVAFNWTAPAQGTPTSYILEAGSAAGLSNVAVLNTGTPATSLVVPSVPAGRYYLRLRAANALGQSVPSAEYVLVVP